MSWFGKKEEKKEQTFAFDPSSVQDVSSFLGSNMDASKLHPLAGLNNGGNLEYLDLSEDSTFGAPVPGSTGIFPIKDWTDDLCYGTGTVYLAGLGVGGAYGLQEGLKKTAGTTSAKLRLNGVLNAVTRRGPFLGNSAGVLALTYNLINASIDHLRGQHDSANSLAAGALSGALFKATKGLRPMAISAGLMTSAAGAWCLVKKAVF